MDQTSLEGESYGNESKGDSELLRTYIGHELQLKQKITKSVVVSYLNAKHKGMQNDDQKSENFPALHINIGSWTWTSSRQGDFMAKLYFRKNQLIWEFLKDTLKFKMEMQLSDITAIHATSCDPNQQSSLEIELNKPPKFFQESNPKPRMHTTWEPCDDFTDGRQASQFRRHHVIFSAGVLQKPFQKLMELDKRLSNLIQKPFPSDAEASPYFDRIEPASTSGNVAGQHYPTTARGSPNSFTATNSSEPVTSSLRNEEGRNVQTATPDMFCVNVSNFNIQCPSYNNAIQSYSITTDNIYDNLRVDSRSVYHGERSDDMITRNDHSNYDYNYGLMANVNNYTINSAVTNDGYRDANLAMMQNVGRVDSVPPLNAPEMNESSNVNVMDPNDVSNHNNTPTTSGKLQWNGIGYDGDLFK